MLTMYFAIYFWTLLLILSLMFSAGDNYILRFTSVIIRTFMLGILTNGKLFFSDSLLGATTISTLTLYRLLLIFNTFLIYIGVVAVFELVDRDMFGRKKQQRKQ